MNKKSLSRKSLVIIICVVVVVAAAAAVYFAFFRNTNVQYRNTEYGFTFNLPQSWKGYTIVNEQWTGTPVDSSGTQQNVTGPQIIIRNPNWTSADPYQDIPIMIFTPDQWDLVQQGNLAVSAAPFPPTEIGSNAKYVFAIPPRYNYAFPTGWQEVEQIISDNTPLHTF
jgi:hypothetical protein